MAHRDGFQNSEADAIETWIFRQALVVVVAAWRRAPAYAAAHQHGSVGMLFKEFRRCHVESLGDRDAREPPVAFSS